MKRILLALALCAFALGAFAQTLSDTTTTPSLPPRVNSYPMLYNGTTWDLVRGDTTSGLWVNVKAWNGTALVPGTGATNLGKAEDAGHTTGDTGVMLLAVRKDTATQTTNADADYAQISVDAYGAVFSRSDHPNRITCTVAVSTATTIQAVGSPCSAPGAGLSIYITDILFSASAAGIAADAFPTLKYGTGGTCGTGTTVFWGALTAAAIVATDNRTMPIKIPANNEVCWITSTAGSKFLVLGGYIAP